MLHDECAVERLAYRSVYVHVPVRRSMVVCDAAMTTFVHSSATT